MKINIPNVEPDSAFLVVGAAGVNGINGVNGRDGERGRDGRDGVDGLGFNLRGEWQPGNYEPHDVVEHEGSSYVAKVATKSEPPSRAWQLLASKGERGEQGERGIASKGQKGDRGESALADTVATADVPMAIGDVIYASGADRVDLAQANGDATSTVVGMVTSVKGSVVKHRSHGTVENPNWSLTPLSVYYLSPTVAGGMTTVFPNDTGHFVIILGTAVSPTKLALNIHWMLENG